jgi:ABC-2 type transport system permease protein
MSAKRIALLIWKEFTQFRRDPLMLRLVIVMPLLQLMMFGYVVGADVRNLPTRRRCPGRSRRRSPRAATSS